MSEVKVNKVSPRSGTALTVGDSGDTVTVTGNDIRSDAYKASDGGNLVSQSGTTVTLGASGDTVQVAGGATFVGGGITWQSSIKTTAFTAVAGEAYWINTVGGAVTVTLPASGSVGDQLIFSDYSRSWGLNAVTLNTNSLKFQGNATSSTGAFPIYNTDGQTVHIVYSGATQGWIPQSDDDSTLETPQFYNVDFLVVGGGGGGGQDSPKGGGGGGAGGYRNSFASESSGGGGSSEAVATFAAGSTYTITVGSGGAVNTNGLDSTLSGLEVSISSLGGGCGGGPSVGNGGCGGGGTGLNNNAGPKGTGTANQGFNGGDGVGAGASAGGGGGGAGEVGNADGSSYGGDGLSSSITGSAVDRGGGGSGQFDQSSKPGGTGGGGTGAVADTSTAATAGTANTGGGGGGGNSPSNGAAAAGGAGVVILRMATANYSGTTTGSPTVTTSGSDTIIQFNADGSIRA
jgi:hypothetical protein